MYQTLLTSLEDHIFTITINRKEKMNALNRMVIAELALALDEVYGRPEILSAILTGAGEAAFVAGADISEFLELDPAGATALARIGQEKVFDRIAGCPKPIVAAVNGFALGGGCELAMAAHFRIASDSAKFGQPEVGLGLIPGYGGTQRLVELVGKGKALELMMTADMIHANEAHRIGLVNHVVPPITLMDFTRDILQKIQTRAPLAIAKLVACVQSGGSQKGYEMEIQSFGACFGTRDLQEGARAFLEKRPPLFQGS
ncbi:MAG: enoyl-CoA hydratase/isomerase family protein [Chitinophagaceae bacterium]